MFSIPDNSIFKPAHQPNAIAKEGDFLFFYDDKKIGLTLENTIPILKIGSPSTDTTYCFGHINHRQCLLEYKNYSADLQFIESPSSYLHLPEEIYQAVAIGSHLYHFRMSHRYCGKCSSLTLDKKDEQALICSACSHIIYPKISPCVIMLITRGREMLLARSPHFRPEMMSTLAGFVSIGETIEQTVVREIKEEVGIEVENLKYVCSQPWPFPDSLMLGFTAEYKSGEITIDNREIEKAGWFDKDNLPLLPNKMSIARYLIETHLQNNSAIIP